MRKHKTVQRTYYKPVFVEEKEDKCVIHQYKKNEEEITFKKLPAVESFLNNQPELTKGYHKVVVKQSLFINR